jgi:O-antigen/teichoic acid export membrane protein
MRGRRGVQLVKDVVVYAAGLVLRRGLSIVTLPVLARTLTQADFGIVALLGTVRDLLTVVLELGVPNAAARFFYDCGSAEERRRLFGTLTILVMGAAIAGAGLALAVGPVLWPRAVPGVPFHPYVSLTVATVFFMMASVVPRSIFRVTGRVPLFMTLSVAQGALSAAVTIALAVLAGLGALAPVLGALASAAVFFSSTAPPCAGRSRGPGRLAW